MRRNSWRTSSSPYENSYGTRCPTPSEQLRLQADHRAADHLGTEADLVDGLHHADRVERIGADHQDILVGSPRWEPVQLAEVFPALSSQLRDNVTTGQDRELCGTKEGYG